MKVYKLGEYFCAECRDALLPFTKDGDTTNIYLEHQRTFKHPLIGEECSQSGVTGRVRLNVHEIDDDLQKVQ